MNRDLSWVQCVATLTVLSCLASPLYSQAIDRITSPIDNTARVSLPNAVHPALAAATGSAAVEPGFPLNHMVLALQPSAAQQAALETLLRQQQDASSANYHRFLTPDQFAASYGASQNDVGKLTAWLAGSGFHVDEVAANRLAVVFSGDAAHVAAAFKTEVRRYVVNGETHFANASAPQIPAALSPVVQGFVKLNDFHSKSSTTGLKFMETDSAANHYLAPADYAVIYDLNTLFNSGVTGAAQSVAIIGRSDVNASDLAIFRADYGLTANTVTTIIASGSDPGFTADGDAMEATLDVEWAAATAPGVTVKLVIAASTASTDGVDLAALYAVTHNTAPIISVSFGNCEAVLNNAFYSQLWKQAAAQGISVLVAAGDSGAAGCDSSTAANGSVRGVNGMCSTLYSTCVGGSMFADTSNPGQYWLPGNNSVMGSAISYIPETVWNESAFEIGGTGLSAGGGGVSTIYAKPYWQTGTGVPADGMRDVPDVVLSASEHDGYLIFYSGSRYVASGTSAATPSFAGILALVTQANGGAQGQINQTLYPLAAKTGSSAIFHDIVSGSNSVPGVGGYAATTGYDLASGLGSVDGTQLVTQWTSATSSFSFAPSALSVTASPAQHGSLSVTATDTGGFHSGVTLSATGLPGGVVANFAPNTIPAGTGSSAVTFAVSGWAASGTYPITVTATGGGVTRSASFSLVVVVATACTLTATPASLTLLQSTGKSVSVACGAAQGVFSGNLTLSASGAPAGVTTIFSNASIPAQVTTTPAGMSALTISAGPAVTPGSYAVLVTATLPNSNPVFTRTLSVPFTVTAPSTFNVTPSVSALSLQQGAAATITLTSLHSGAFNSSVSFSTSGLPSILTATLSTNTLAAPGDGTAVISLQAGSTLPAGKYALTVLAQGGGLSVRIPIAVTVTLAPAFSFTAAGAVMTLRQSNTASVTVTTSTLTGNFDLPVNLSVSGLPVGVTAAFLPASIAAPGAGSSVLTLTAGATATTGIATITLSATGGVITRYANIKLILTPPPTFTISVSIPSYSMNAGGTLTETITATGLYGYSSNIQLSAGTLPPGLNVSFLNTTINGSYGTTTMTIQPAASLAAGSYPITVSGTDQVTNNTQTAIINLLVGNVTTSLSTSSLSLAPSSSASATITSVAKSYSGNVAFSLGDLPFGVSYSLSRATLPGSGSSNLTISAGASARPGTYVVTVRSAAGGVASTSAITLVIG